MVKPYIASPYANGDKIDNVNLQLDVANELIVRGFAPYVPLLAHYQQARHLHEEHEWLSIDHEWLKCCDVLVRMKPIKDGKEVPSSGADKEEAWARELGIPVFVFYTVAELVLFLESNELTNVFEEGVAVSA